MSKSGQNKHRFDKPYFNHGINTNTESLHSFFIINNRRDEKALALKRKNRKHKK
jgi:hypothetical protein